MTTVAIQDLRDHLDEYVKRVNMGECIQLTDRGKVVAELRHPSPRSAIAPRHPKGLVELAKQGRARLGRPNTPELYPPRPVRRPAGTAARLLDEDRGDR